MQRAGLYLRHAAAVASRMPSIRRASAAAASAAASETSAVPPAFAVPAGTPPITVIERKPPQIFQVNDALAALKADAAKPQTLRAHFVVDMKGDKTRKGRPRDPIRFNFVFPHRFTAARNVIALASGTQAEEALKAGATHAGMEDLIEKIKTGQVTYDVIVATPDAMQSLKKVAGQVLRRDTPTAKKGTLGENLPELIANVAGGITVRSDDKGAISVPFTKTDRDSTEARENLSKLVTALNDFAYAKRERFIQKFMLSGTQRPGAVLIDPAELIALDAKHAEVQAVSGVKYPKPPQGLGPARKQAQQAREILDLELARQVRNA